MVEQNHASAFLPAGWGGIQLAISTTSASYSFGDCLIGGRQNPKHTSNTVLWNHIPDIQPGHLPGQSFELLPLLYPPDPVFGGNRCELPHEFTIKHLQPSFTLPILSQETNFSPSHFANFLTVPFPR